MTVGCPKCHFNNSPDSKFCKECGTQLEPPEEIQNFTQTLELPLTVLTKGSLFAGKYEIVEELGRGGMGIVYRARDRNLKRMVALKFLSPHLLGDLVQRKRFIQEAQTASALNHPNICTIYEVGEADGKTYIAMEYVEGRPLNTMTRPAGLSLEDTVRYGIQIAEAVEHASSRNIIHRDLKTANIIVTTEGRAKVLDFGLAKRLRDDELDQAALSQVSLAESGLIAGTLPYMAPEVLCGRDASAQSDIWALGIVLYEMVSGKLPFEGKTGFELTSSIMRDPPPALPTLVPDTLLFVIHKCLEKEPEKRFKTADEVRAALEDVRSIQGAGLSTLKAGVWRKWLPWFLIGIAVVALVLIAIVKSKHAAEAEPARIQPRVSTGAKASSNPEANEYFEKAMLFLIPQFDLARARTLLGRSLELDPKFGEARAWYAFTFVLDIDSGLSNDTSSLYKAEEELKLALQDAPDTARVHSSLAALYFYQGRKELIPGTVKKALEIDPKELDANIWLANYHISNDDYPTARAVLSPLLAGNPLFFPARMTLAEILRQQGDIPGAISELEKIFEQAPQNLYAAQKMARALIDANDLVRARKVLERLSPGDQESYEIRLTWALLLLLEGKKQEAMQKIDNDTLKYSALAIWSTSIVAEFYALLGEPQKALEWLELAVRNGDEREEWFRRDPLLLRIRGLPRFRQILDSIAARRLQRK